MQEGGHRIGYILLGVVVLVWGANFGIVKSAYRDLPPIHFAALRFSISGVLLLIVTYWKEKGVRIRKEDLGKVVIVGTLGLGFYQILWSLGLNLTSASNSALIYSTQPLLAALYVDMTKKESVEKRQYWNMLLALAGVVLVILKPTARLYFSLNTLSGDLLTLMAGICSAVFFSAWSKPLLKIYSPLRLMSNCMIVGSFILWVAALFSPHHVAWDQIGEKAWWSMGYAVVCSGMMAHVLWYRGIERIGVAKTLVFTYFIPLCAVLFNYFFMGEKIYSQQVLGGVLILLGVHRVLRS